MTQVHVRADNKLVQRRRRRRRAGILPTSAALDPFTKCYESRHAHVRVIASATRVTCTGKKFSNKYKKPIRLPLFGHFSTLSSHVDVKEVSFCDWSASSRLVDGDEQQNGGVRNKKFKNSKIRTTLVYLHCRRPRLCAPVNRRSQ